MTLLEKEAIMNYLDFKLTNLCEEMSDHVCSRDDDYKKVNAVYDLCYDVLNDMDDTFQLLLDLQKEKI